MRQLKDGVFNLTKDVFDPKETLELVTETFGAQASGKDIEINFEIVSSLRTPDTMYTYLTKDSP